MVKVTAKARQSVAQRLKNRAMRTQAAQNTQPVVVASTSGRPRRATVRSRYKREMGMSWAEEADLKRALYLSINDAKRRPNTDRRTRSQAAAAAAAAGNSTSAAAAPAPAAEGVSTRSRSRASAAANSRDESAKKACAQRKFAEPEASVGSQQQANSDEEQATGSRQQAGSCRQQSARELATVQPAQKTLEVRRLTGVFAGDENDEEPTVDVHDFVNFLCYRDVLEGEAARKGQVSQELLSECGLASSTIATRILPGMGVRQEPRKETGGQQDYDACDDASAEDCHVTAKKRGTTAKKSRLRGGRESRTGPAGMVLRDRTNPAIQAVLKLDPFGSYIYGDLLMKMGLEGFVGSHGDVNITKPELLAYLLDELKYRRALEQVFMRVIEYEAPGIVMSRKHSKKSEDQPIKAQPPYVCSATGYHCYISVVSVHGKYLSVRYAALMGGSLVRDPTACLHNVFNTNELLACIQEAGEDN